MTENCYGGWKCLLIFFFSKLLHNSNYNRVENCSDLALTSSFAHKVNAVAISLCCQHPCSRHSVFFNFRLSWSIFVYFQSLLTIAWQKDLDFSRIRTLIVRKRCVCWPLDYTTTHLTTTLLWSSGEQIFTDMGDTFHYYSLALCVFQYFLPLALMTYFYSMVAATIWRRRDICQVRCGSIPWNIFSSGRSSWSIKR